jgi:hypothetical protein
MQASLAVRGAPQRQLILCIDQEAFGPQTAAEDLIVTANATAGLSGRGVLLANAQRVLPRSSMCLSQFSFDRR